MSKTSRLVVLFGCLLGPDLRAFAAEPAAGGATFVIIHGAWGGSWAFRRVEALLTARGHRVHRVALTGLGERVHLATPDVGLATHVTDVANHLVFEELEDVVLVGHSYGGMVVTGAADREPGRIRRLVYLDAFLPEDGESVVTLPFRRDQRAAWLKPMTKDGYLVPPWVKPDQPLPRDVPQPAKTFTEPISLKNGAAARIPATYILTIEKGAQDDDFSPYAERARGRGFAVETLEADHNPQWSAPEALVERLHRAATASPRSSR
jgi:pimeloyl-ACP methyl ester carboxylesterase